MKKPAENVQKLVILLGILGGFLWEIPLRRR